MVRVWIIFGFIFLSLNAAQAETPQEMILRKQQEAEAKKMELLQRIQHTKANPGQFSANAVEADSPTSVSFDQSGNGHYYVPTTINGKSIDFLADTGASSVFISQATARQLGLNVASLNYNRTYITASGKVQAAETTVPKLKVGPIEIENMPITISTSEGSAPLLGMDFFNRLSSYEVKNNKMTMYK